jgi:prepilin-type N-terminal cleavage/methylation domain-containing protein
MKKNQKGVTLLELVVVFAIIAITAVLVIPNLGSWLTNYRLRSAARDVTSTLRTAQMRSVSNNLFYRVEFTGSSYTLTRSTSELRADPWDNEGVAQTLPSGISIKSNSFAGNKALFRPNSSSNGGTVVLQNKIRQTTITVVPTTGRITVQ